MTDGLRDMHREAIIAAIAANEHVERAVLFGSRATGAHTVSSDVDIALFGGRLTLTDQARLAAVLDGLPMAQRVDLLLYKTVDNPALREQIERHGVEWYRRPQGTAETHVVEGAGGGTLPQSPQPSRSRGMADGRIPIRLGEVCRKIGSGATPRGGREVYLEEGPYALIRSQNVHNDGFRFGGLAFIGKQHANELSNVEVLIHDVLLNITGDSVARACQVDPRVLPARVNQHVAIIRPNPERLDPKFLRYLLIFPSIQNTLLSLSGSGGTRNALTKGIIESFEVAAPESINQQRAIGHILGTLDDKIEVNRRMNATLEAMARAVFKDWFIDFGPTRARMEGREPYLASEIWDLFPDKIDDEGKPEGWELSEIGKEVETVGGATPSTKEPSFWKDGEHHWVTPKDLSKLASPVLLNTDRKITNAGIKRINSGLLPVGTVLLSSRAPIGYLAIAEVPTSVNQGFIAMVCEKRLPNVFVLFWCHENLDYIKGISGGSTFAEISKKAFRPVPVAVPSEQILNAYESLIRPLYDRIVANTKESASLARTRNLLLPNLMSGEIRLADVKKVTT